jgi:hypothetical protein
MYPHQAFRVGRRVYGVQFHIETTPDMVRWWAEHDLDGVATTGYDLDALMDRITAVHPDLEEIWAPFAATPRQLIERVRKGSLTALAAGDGSLRFREELEAGGIPVGPAGTHAVRGLHICRLATRVPAVPPEAVLPNYLREPDAKPQR